MAVAWWVPGSLIFFRAALRSGFDKMFGDVGDNRLIVLYHEHWLQVVRGKVSWTSPNYFYPAKGVLGYSDTCVLNEVFYLPLRLARLDPFLALQWTIVLMSLTGFVSMFFFLRMLTQLSRPVCGALSLVCIFANNVSVSASHLQLLSLFWIPPILLVGLCAWRAQSRLARMTLSSGCGLLFGTLAYSTFYIAWFAGFALLIFVAVFGCLRIRSGGWRHCKAQLQLLWGRAAMVVMGFAVAMIPFVITYLPALRKSGGRPYSVVMDLAQSPRDVVNLGSSNYLWGSLVRAHLPAARISNVELSTAVTPFVLVLVAIAVLIAIRLRRTGAQMVLSEACIACGVTTLIVILLPIDFGFVSLWRVPWAVVPGAAGIRAIGRGVVVAGPVAVLGIALGIRLVLASPGLGAARRWRSGGLGVVLAMLVIEQINLGQNSGVDRSEQLLTLASAPAPPLECRSFYVISSTTAPVASFHSEIDAMLLAQRIGLPTVNGYSGLAPDGFGALNPDDADYVALINDWAYRQHNLPGLCVYARLDRHWILPG